MTFKIVRWMDVIQTTDERIDYWQRQQMLSNYQFILTMFNIL